MVNMPFMCENARPGFAYVPYQEFKELYNNEEALNRGTLFKELDIPFNEYAENPIMNPFKSKEAK